MYVLTGLLGLLLILAPFLFEYDFHIIASFMSIAVGMSLIIVSSLESVENEVTNWEYWIAVVLGIVIMLAPFLVGYTNLGGALWTSLVIGLAVVLGSITRLFQKKFF